jgi:hypothetical protein
MHSTPNWWTLPNGKLTCNRTWEHVLSMVHWSFWMYPGRKREEAAGKLPRTASSCTLVVPWEGLRSSYRIMNEKKRGCVGLPSSISCQQARLRGACKEERETRMTLCRRSAISHTHLVAIASSSRPFHSIAKSHPSHTSCPGADVGRAGPSPAQEF